MSKTLTPVAIATMILVTALVTVEHDREKHIPGVKTGPQAETFLVPEHVAESLIKAGAVKRADVVDADALLSQVDTSVTGASTSTGVVTTFADVADMAEADRLRAQLADAAAARDNLIEQLADTQEQLAEVSARLAAADTQLTLTASAETTDVGTLVAETNAATADTAAEGGGVVSVQVAAEADATAVAEAIAADLAATTSTTSTTSRRAR